MLRRFLDDPHLFPKVIICLYVLSSVRYAVAKDYGRTLYWFAAGLITVSTTFFKFK